MPASPGRALPPNRPRRALPPHTSRGDNCVARAVLTSPPRMPVVMLLQLGAATLCLRKRTPQIHLLWVGYF